MPFKIFVLVVLCLFGPSCISIDLGPRMTPLDETVISGKGDNKVLLVDIAGVIADSKKKSFSGASYDTGMVEKVREILGRAEKDQNIKALWLRINSPGGTVTASDMIYHDLKVFKEKKNIKVFVTIMDMAASGGYYIAMAGDKIIAHPTSITGSIGVISMKLNLQTLMDKVGVGFEVVKSGDKKDFLSPLRPLTEEERKLFQEIIDAYFGRFVAIIAENRSQLGLDAVKKLADGRVYTADQALAEKLIDRIAYLDETEEIIKNELQLPEVKVVTYHRSGEYKANLYSLMPKETVVNLINVDMDFPSTSPLFMYLWMP